MSSSDVIVSEDAFTIDDEIFSIGSLVTLYSCLSQENFHGLIISISTFTVVIRCGSGTRFSFQFDHLKSGRSDSTCLSILNPCSLLVKLKLCLFLQSFDSEMHRIRGKQGYYQRGIPFVNCMIEFEIKLECLIAIKLT